MARLPVNFVKQSKAQKKYAAPVSPDVAKDDQGVTLRFSARQWTQLVQACSRMTAEKGHSFTVPELIEHVIGEWLKQPYSSRTETRQGMDAWKRWVQTFLLSFQSWRARRA